MACNCTTTEQLNELYKRYSVDSKLKKGETLSGKIKYYSYKFGLIMVLLLIIPMLVIYAIYVSTFKDGKISLRKFFNLKGNNITDYYGRQQQKFKDKNESRE